MIPQNALSRAKATSEKLVLADISAEVSTEFQSAPAVETVIIPQLGVQADTVNIIRVRPDGVSNEEEVATEERSGKASSGHSVFQKQVTSVVADPTFKEIVNTALEPAGANRDSFSSVYNPSNKTYAHEYRSNNSNWYYFNRRGY